MFTTQRQAAIAHSVHANRVIEGDVRTTLVVGGLEGRREKTDEERQAERQADRTPYGEVLKDFGWTRADFDTAKEYGFPAQVSSYSAGPLRGQGIYSKSAIAAWREKLLTFSAKLKAR
jgi:hypothetical protein